MEKNKQIWIGVSVGIVLILFVLWRLMVFLGANTTKASDPFSIIPKDAILILHIRNDKDLIENSLNKSPLWDELRQWENIKEIKDFADSLLGKTNKADYQKISDNNEWVLSLHPSTNNRLCLMVTKPLIPGTKITDIIKNGNSIFDDWEFKELSAFKTKCAGITSPEWNGILWGGLKDGLLILTKDSLLFQKTVQGHELNSVKNDKGFIKAYNTSGKQAALNIYLNIQYIKPWLGSVFSQSLLQTAWIKNTKGWACLDVVVHNQILLLSGTLNTLSINTSPFDILQSQVLTSPGNIKNLPNQDLGFFGIQTPDFLSFQQKLIESKYLTQQLADSLNQIIPNQWLQGIYLYQNHFPLDSKTIIIQLNDSILPGSIEEMMKNQSSEIISPKQPKGSLIYKSKLGSLIANNYGPPFSSFDTDYCSLLNNKIIASNDTFALQSIIRVFNMDNGLGAQTGFSAIREILPQNSVVSSFINPSAISLNDTSVYSEPFLSYLLKNMASYTKFDALGFCANPVGTNWQLSLALQYNPIATRGLQPLWQLKLDTLSSGHPYSFINREDGTAEVIISDIANCLYQISSDGQLNWKISIGSPILSEIYQIDYYLNGKYQYMFNTADSLYLIDRKGESVKDFPKALPEKATSGLALLDYENNKDYRLLVPTVSKTIYNFNKEGKSIKDWYHPQSKYPINSKIQYLRIKNNEYLIAVDTMGNPYIYNRKGQVRIKIPEGLMVQKNAVFYSDDQSKPPRIICLGQGGNIVAFDIQGKQSKLKPDSIHPEARLIVVREKEGKQLQYLISSKNILSLYSKKGELIWGKTFSGAITETRIVSGAGQDPLIAVQLADLDEITMLDIKGSVKNGFPIIGQGFSKISTTKGQNSFFSTYKTFVFKFSIE